MHSRLSSRGLVILGFPCNQFGKQEPGTNAEIEAFARSKGAQFQLFEKIEVNGPHATAAYKWMKSQKKDTIGAGIKWNFAKFLIGRDGKVANRYMPTTDPLSIEPAILKLLDGGGADSTQEEESDG